MKSHNVCALAAVLLALAGPALATVKVKLSQNTVMDLKAPAGTVLVGDPAIADVSLITPRRIAILGRGYGATNVIITDRIGRVIFQEEIQVSRSTANQVSIHRGAQVSSLTCSPGCERAGGQSEDAAVNAASTLAAKDVQAAASGASAANGVAQPPPPPR